METLARPDLHLRVENALASLRPYLAADGGDIQLLEITEDRRVRVELLGSCAACSMMQMTMKGGVEEAIRQAAPEVVSVEAVNLQV